MNSSAKWAFRTTTPVPQDYNSITWEIYQCRLELHRWHEKRAKRSSDYWFINGRRPRPENETLYANRGAA